MIKDPLAITHGLALTDVGLAHAGLSREERRAIWGATLHAIVQQSDGLDLGLGATLVPGVHLELGSRRDGLVRAEMGWPLLAGGSGQLRVPLRRFGSDSWDLDGGSWAPGWWSRVQGAPGAVPWDDAQDLEQVVASVEGSFDLVWMNDLWPRMSWWQATPGWVDLVFPRCHAAMKRGILAALEVAEGSGPIWHIPVLANGVRLEKATLKSLKQAKTALFSPSEAGYRAFVENVRSQAVPKHVAMSMAATWWSRAFDEAVVP